MHNRLYKGMSSFCVANTDCLKLLNFNLLTKTLLLLL